MREVTFIFRTAKILSYVQVKESAELELQLLTERRARQAAEASLHEQKLLAEKIMADMTALAEKAAMDSKQAIKEALEKAAIAHAHEVARVSRMNDSPQVNNSRQHV
jgi:DNA primase catalytic subunit